MKKNATYIFQFLFLFVSIFSFYGGCKEPQKTNPNNPPNGSQPATIKLSRPEEGTNEDHFQYLDFANGPCKDLFEPSTFTVRIVVYSMANNGNRIQYGTTQLFPNVTIPPFGPIILSGIQIPTGGEWWLEAYYSMDNCSACCSWNYLHNKMINEGCQATIATSFVEQGKPQLTFTSTVIQTSLINPVLNLQLIDFICYCDCL